LAVAEGEVRVPADLLQREDLAAAEPAESQVPRILAAEAGAALLGVIPGQLAVRALFL
jgi:hypothetical protein